MATTFLKKQNNAKSVITNNPLAIGATSVGITAGTETKFPTTGNFYVTLFDATTYPDPSDDPNMEYVLATRSGTDTYTITATTKAHAQGSAFRLEIMKEHMDEHEVAINALEAIGAAAASPVIGEVPTGTVNGVNAIFTTASTYATGTLQVFKNGIRLKGGGADYTETGPGTGFTMVTAPVTGAVLIVNYFKTVNFATIGTNSLVEDETPTGTINGSNTAFTVLKGSFIAGSLAVYLNGQKLTHTNDFTETTPGSGTFAFVVAPATGATVRVGYQFNQNAAGNADTVDGFHASSTPAANTIIPLDANAIIPPAVNKKMKLWEQGADGTNTERTNQITYRGWGYIKGDGTGAIYKTVTLPNGGFDDTGYEVFLTYRGTKGGIPSSRVDVTTEYSLTGIRITSNTLATAAAFSVEMTLSSGTYDAANYQIFSWVAIGTKA